MVYNRTKNIEGGLSMGKIIVTLLLASFGLLFAFWGWKLRQGKWLRSMAGNNFNELPKEKALKEGKTNGLLMYGSGIFILLFILPIWSDNELLFTAIIWLTGIVTILGLAFAVHSIVEWMKHG